MATTYKPGQGLPGTYQAGGGYLAQVNPAQKPRFLPTQTTINLGNAQTAQQTSMPAAIKRIRHVQVPAGAALYAQAIPEMAGGAAQMQAFAPAQRFSDALTQGHDQLAADRESTALAGILNRLDQQRIQYEQQMKMMQTQLMSSLMGKLMNGFGF
jgi:hypothetical protein